MRFFLAILISILILTPHKPMAQSSIDKTIHISGSTTVTNYVFSKDYTKDLSDKTGIPLDIHVSSSGRGVLALIEGRADIAMISTDFPKLIKKLEALQGFDIDESQYQIHKVEETEVLFVVHHSNPLNEITLTQAKDLFTGKINNWSQMGLENLGTVKIVTEHPTGGIYSTVLQQVTDKEPITDDKIIMQTAPKVAVVVSQIPTAFGFLSDATPPEIKNKVKILKIANGQKPIQRMYFVTRKDEKKPEVLKLVKTIQEDVLR